MKKIAGLAMLVQICAFGQEADSGFELRTTISTAGFYSPKLEQNPRAGAPVDAGFRSVFYPTWKLSRNWSASGAIQVYSRPYFMEQFNTQGHGVKTDVLQAYVSYSRFWNRTALVVRAGQLSSAFGSFLLRYDDAANPLVNMPLSYGYYYKSVSTLGLTGAQIDLVSGKMDGRVQLVNSSPANRRSAFDSDQYGNWAGGLGYTIVQGLRVGTSAYYGPYLHRTHPHYRAREAKPSEVPAYAYATDVQWSRGHWSAQGEVQRFTKTYRAVPTVKNTATYGEFRRVLHPRWYIAARAEAVSSSRGTKERAFETAIGFRPAARHLIKLGHQVASSTNTPGMRSNSVIFQFVTELPSFSLARD